MQLEFKPLADNLSFGLRVTGLTESMTSDPAVREKINTAFEKAGMLIFEGVEPTNQMQAALSNVFGEMKEHPVPSIARVDRDSLPGVIELRSGIDSGGIIELNGEKLSHWLPWHFDHCYNDELNRAGILRSAKIVNQGGRTGFMDGIALYNAFPKELLEQIEDREIYYKLNVQFETQRFGVPASLKVLRSKPMGKAFDDQAEAMPRAIHPAVWTRPSGEKVLHASPYMAEGFVGHEDESGNALFREVCETIERLAPDCSYHHSWSEGEMLIWDNWRMLHCVSGHDPSVERVMYRTTIKGDYGLGRFENNANGNDILRNTTV